MNIDIKMVGKRLKTLRKEKGYTQEKLSEVLSAEPYYINHERQYIGRIEHGEDKALLDLPLLEALAGIFDCDIGYLLGEITEKTYDVKAIHDITNLSEPAISNIISNANNVGTMSVINAMLENSMLYSNVVKDVLMSMRYTLYDSLNDIKGDDIKLLEKALALRTNQYDLLNEIARAKTNAAAYKFQLSNNATNMFTDVINELLQNDFADILGL